MSSHAICWHEEVELWPVLPLTTRGMIDIFRLQSLGALLTSMFVTSHCCDSLFCLGPSNSVLSLVRDWVSDLGQVEVDTTFGWMEISSCKGRQKKHKSKTCQNWSRNDFASVAGEISGLWQPSAITFIFISVCLFIPDQSLIDSLYQWELIMKMYPTTRKCAFA